MTDSYENYGITLPNSRTTGEVTTTCPKCSADRKGKNQKIKCLGVNLDKKVWRCNHCEWAGGLRLEKKEEKVYVKPIWRNKTQLSEGVVKWFEGRGISQKTLTDFRITEGMEWMPQAEKEMNTIQFNYFRNDEFVNAKYRTGNKFYKFVKDAEKIFYNFDAILTSQVIYIVEGEMDCLSMYESGLNAISVPNGANSNFDYLDACIDLFNGKTIHLAFDNDIKGRELRDAMADRFGRERCDYIDFKDCKDANEYLVKYGKRGLVELCESPTRFPLEGVFSVNDYSDEIADMYINGLDRGVSTGIEGFDLNIVKGYLTVITGIPSHGKSDWLDNICLNLRVRHEWKGAFYSPENRPTQLHFSKMARKLIGKSWDGRNRMSFEEVSLAQRFLDNTMWFIKPEKDFSLTSILSQIKQLQHAHGLDYFVIDAWNKLEHKGKGDTEYIGTALDEIVTFCEVNNVHCFLVAHPTKMAKEDNGKYKIPTLYNIAGSANFYNKADNGVCVYRDFDTNITTVYRQKIKFDHWGTDGYSEYKYNVESKRYQHGLYADTTNWITKDAEIKAIEAPKIKPSEIFDEPKENDIFTESNEQAPF